MSEAIRCSFLCCPSYVSVCTVIWSLHWPGFRPPSYPSGQSTLSLKVRSDSLAQLSSELTPMNANESSPFHL